MNVLDNILNCLEDDSSSEQESQIQTTPKNQPVAATTAGTAAPVKPPCDHNRVLGNPSTGAICLECDEHLTQREMQELDYRQFSLLFCNENEYLRAEFGKT